MSPKRLETRWLLFAASLAFGEAVASRFPQAAEWWIFVLFAAAIIALIGYGFKFRAWPYVAVAMFGVAIFLSGEVERERTYRDTPWMRKSEQQRREQLGESRVRTNLSERMAIGLETKPMVCDVNRAILLGERFRMPRELKSVFQDSGTTHVFAISGLHVMIIAGVLMFIVAVFGTHLRWQGLLAMPPLWGFVYLVGHPPSAIRAALMATVYFMSPVVGRKPNGLIAWAVSFILIHLLVPSQIANVGSMLSFIVMLTLVFAVRIARCLPSAWARFVFISFFAWAASVPIVAAIFGRVTPGGLVSNLIVVTLASNTVVFGAIGVLASFVSIPLAAHCNNLSALSTELMIEISSFVAAIPGANIEIPQWGLLTCLAWYVAMALTLYLIWHIASRRKTMI